MLKTIERYEETFGTEGWKEFVEDITEKSKTLFPQLMNRGTTEADLNIAKGMHYVYQYIVGLEQTVAGLRDHLELQMKTEEVAEDVDAVRFSV